MNRKPVRPAQSDIPRKQVKVAPARSLPIALALATHLGNGSPVIHTLRQQQKHDLNAELAADVSAFLPAGGQIQTFRPGESAQSIRDGEAERALRIQQQMRANPRKA